jgi:pullulanase/glycogen debranching enzyme
MTVQILPGSPYPIGATPGPGGVNFSVFADKADAIELLFFDRVDGPPTRVIRLNPHEPAGRDHHTYHYWHVCVPDARPGQIYAYRAIWPYAPERGIWYDPDKVLLDPYGRAVAVPAGASKVLLLPLYRRGDMNLHELGPADPESARSGRAASLPDGSGRRATARVPASTSLWRRFLTGN